MNSPNSKKAIQSILVKREFNQFLTEITDFPNRKSRNEPQSKVKEYQDCMTFDTIIKLKQILADSFETNPTLFLI